MNREALARASRGGSDARQWPLFFCDSDLQYSSLYRETHTEFIIDVAQKPRDDLSALTERGECVVDMSTGVASFVASISRSCISNRARFWEQSGARTSPRAQKAAIRRLQRRSVQTLHHLCPPTTVERRSSLSKSPAASRPCPYRVNWPICNAENAFLQSRVELPPIEKIPVIDARLAGQRGLPPSGPLSSQFAELYSIQIESVLISGVFACLSDHIGLKRRPKACFACGEIG
jgi:hypothetical protein